MIKTKWSDLEALATKEQLVWREHLKKNKWGPPVSFQQFREPPYHVNYTPDRYGDIVDGEKVQVFGHIKMRRARFYLCKA